MTMHIPQHINAHGEPIASPAVNGRQMTDRERVMEMMNVPDRIVLTGGGGYAGFNAEPQLDRPIAAQHEQPAPIILTELPAKLTLADELTYPDEPTIDERSQSSIAVDENPLQELKLMRRQVVRLSTRLYELEEEMDTRRVREKQLWVTVVVGLAATLMTLLLRR